MAKKITIIPITFGLILFFLSTDLFAVTYTVDPGATTSTNQCGVLTHSKINTAIQCAVCGDTVSVKDGTYSRYLLPQPYWTVVRVEGKNCNNLQPITIKAVNRGLAVIDGSNTTDIGSDWQGYSAGIAINSSHNIIVDGFTIKNFNKYKGIIGGVLQDKGQSGINIELSSNIKIINNIITKIGNKILAAGVGQSGIGYFSSSFVLISGNEFSEIGRTNISSNAFDHGVYIQNSSSLSAQLTDVLIEKNRFFNMTQGYPVQIYSSFGGPEPKNITFTYNMIDTKLDQTYLNIGNAGVVLIGTPGAINLNVNNNASVDSGAVFVKIGSGAPQLTNISVKNNFIGKSTQSVTLPLPAGVTATNNKSCTCTAGTCI